MRASVLVGALVMVGAAPHPDRWPLMLLGAVAQLGAVVLLWRERRVALWEVLAGALLLRVLAFGVPPVLSDDAYRYAWDGLLQLQGIDPFAAKPVELVGFQQQHPELFAQLNSAEYYTVYPPVSQLLFLAGALLAGKGLPLLFTIKGLLAVAELGGVALLARMTSARGLMLYAWHPLVVLEVGGQAHTEALAIALLIVVFWADRRDRPCLFGAALAAASWVKLYPLLLLPVVLWRRQWKAVGAFAAVSVLVWAPYLHGDTVPHLLTSLQLYVRHFEFNAGLYYLIKEPIHWMTGFNPSWQVGPLLQVLALGFIAITYVEAKRARCSLAEVWVWAFGAVLFFATTVHPWYVLPLLVVLPLTKGAGWQWQAWSVGALGTYLFYSHDIYWPFVVLAWGSWLVIGLWARGDRLLQYVQRLRAVRKVRWLSGSMPPVVDRILDLGAAEGYVGDEMGSRHAADVTLVDIVDMNRTELPLMCFDGRTLPFPDGRFDVTVLSFVLHHSEEPDRVLREALRVTRGRVLVLESVYVTNMQRGLLERLDKLANGLRSGGKMREQEEHLHFRRREEWEGAFEWAGARVVDVQQRGRLVHRQVLYVLEPAASSTSST